MPTCGQEHTFPDSQLMETPILLPTYGLAGTLDPAAIVALFGAVWKGCRPCVEHRLVEVAFHPVLATHFTYLVYLTTVYIGHPLPVEAVQTAGKCYVDVWKLLAQGKCVEARELAEELSNDERWAGVKEALLIWCRLEHAQRTAGE